MQTLLGRGSIYALGTVIQIASGVLVLPLLTRLLDARAYGMVAIAIVVLSLARVVAGVGLAAPATRSYYRAEDGPGASRALVLWTIAVSCVVALGLELTSGFWVNAFGAVKYDAPLRLAVWSAVPASIVAICLVYLRNADRPGAFVVLIGVSGPAAQLAGIAVIAVLPESGTGGYIGGFAGGQMLAALVGLATVRPFDAPDMRLGFLRASLSIGFPTIPHGLALIVLSIGDRVVIERLEGLETVGSYQVAYVVGTLTVTLLFAFNNAWTPIVFGAPDETRWQVLAETAAALSRLSALVAGAIAVGSPLILLLAAPPAYEPLKLTVVTCIVASAVMPYVMYLAYMQALIWHGRTWSLAWITPTVAVVNVTLVALLLPLLGLEGAALATLLASMVQALLVGAVVRRQVSIRWLRKSTAVAWLVCGGLVLIGAGLPNGGAWLLLRVCLLAAITIALGLAIRGLATREAATLTAGPRSRRALP